jgi:hypothetical protein
VPTHIIAFSTRPGAGCEEADFGLCRFPETIEVDDPLRPGRKQKIPTGFDAWAWGSSCKTQFASNPKHGGIQNFLHCHLTVIRMLEYARELGILDSVYDGGQYWKRRDVKALALEVEDCIELVAAWAGHLRGRFGDWVRWAITDFPNLERLEAAGQSKMHCM